ncbi:NAD-dependent epimerase/dehydratase family protein [Candidatus Bathyarchaeota archaeon]|nr:NAD-dependent epimerase/dehydratase family protein [Candidatus Bathyarchaeota archaeon]
MIDCIVDDIKKNLERSKITYKGRKVLITGGAGFLGSYICQVLVEQEARKVICIDNFSSGKKENIERLLDKPNFTFVYHDISHEFNPEENIDIVMHLASRASPFEFEHHPIQILKSNTLGTMNALEIARMYDAEFFYTSTSEVYGNPDPAHVPTPESYWGHVNPVGPRSCYDESKRAGEAFVKAYELEYNIPVRIARIFNTYGPRIRGGPLFGRVVANFIEETLQDKTISVFGDGSQTRSFTFVSDQIEGLLRLAYPEIPQARSEVINIGNNLETTILDLAKLIKELTNSSSEIGFFGLPKDDPTRRCPVLDKARDILNWKPRTQLVDGLKLTIPWFKFMIH